MDEKELDKINKYFAHKYHLLHFAPASYDFKWFCQYVTREEWWQEFIIHYIGSEAISWVEVAKFLDPEQLVNAVYLFVLERYPESEETEQEKPTITYGKAPTECPVDPVARARCPECAER